MSESEWSRSGVKEVCDDIAAEAIDEASSVMADMAGNEGQSVLCEQLASSAEDNFSNIGNGESVSLDCTHPEAVTIIMQTGEEILNAAAERCAIIRDAANGHNGDLS